MDAPSTPPAAGVAAESLKGETTVEEPDRAGRAIARRSAEIRATVPDLELSVDADAGALLARAEAEGSTTTALLIAACAGGPARVPARQRRLPRRPLRAATPASTSAWSSRLRRRR